MKKFIVRSVRHVNEGSIAYTRNVILDVKQDEGYKNH